MNNPIDRRDRMMAALAAAKHLVAASPTPPRSVETAQHSRWTVGVIGVELHYVNDPRAVEAFATAMGVTAAHHTGAGVDRWYTETAAAGVLGGVPYWAWTRVSITMPRVRPLCELDEARELLPVGGPVRHDRADEPVPYVLTERASGERL